MIINSIDLCVILHRYIFAVMIKYILSFFKPKKVKVEEPINNVYINEYMGDFLDYDGMGNWGRFPPIKK